MPKLVWIVDDDQGILEVTEIVLREAGFDVKKIDSEKNLDKQLQGEPPTVILLDVFIAGAEGKQLARKIKLHPKTKNTPLIMMSADVYLEKKAKEARATDFLRKPYDIEDLEEMVKKYAS